MKRPRNKAAVTVEGRELELSNLDKVLYPEAGFTKGQLIDWYVRISEVLLPHLRGRPLTLKRYPEGVEGEIEHCVVEDAATLAWLANLADVELHTSLSRCEEIERPTSMIFDHAAVLERVAESARTAST